MRPISPKNCSIIEPASPKKASEKAVKYLGLIIERDVEFDSDDE